MSFIKKIIRTIGKKNRNSVLLTILIGFFASTFEVLGVGVMVPLITLIFDKEYLVSFIKNYNDNFNLTSMEDSELIFYLLLIIFLVFVLKFLIMFVYIRLQAVLQKDIQIHLSDKLLDVYIHMPYERHIKYNSSKFIRNVVTEVGLLSNTVLVYMNLLSEILMIFGIVLLMLFYDYNSTLLLFSVFTVSGFIYYYLLREKIHSLGKKRLEYAGKRIQVLQDTLRSTKVGMVHNFSKEYSLNYKMNNDLMSIVGSKFKVFGTLPRILFEFIAITIILVIVFIQISGDRQPEEILTILAIFSVSAVRIMPSANKIIVSLQTLKSSLPGTMELIHELGIKTIKNKTINKSFNEWNKISLINVSYKYPEAKQTSLSDISLDIDRGDVIGIFGHSGSGKSTLIDLIIGLLNPISGEVLVDGVDISGKSRSWMKNIGYVPQETYLLDSTLLHNIAGRDYATNNINKNRLSDAIIVSGLNKIIDNLPEKEMTLVGESGSWLSVGQKQRVGIARALYQNPSLLILDEPTSSLDLQSKDIFRELLSNYKERLSFIIVSHDEKDMEICKKIIKVNNGCIESIVIR